MVNCVHFPFCCCCCSFSLSSDMQGQERFLFWGECRESCPAGHHPAEGQVCLPCPDNCELCHSADICTRCTNGYFMASTNHTCQKLECGPGKAALGPLPCPRRWQEKLYPYVSHTLELSSWFTVSAWDDSA